MKTLRIATNIGTLFFVCFKQETDDLWKETFYKMLRDSALGGLTISPMLIEMASIDDAAEILSLQKLAFLGEAKIHNNFSIPPLVETLDDLKQLFKSHTFLKAEVNGEIVGSVRAFEKDGTCYVGRLMVDPDFQNLGIGTKLLLETKRLFAACRRFELFTGSKSVKNICLYEKLGYKAFKTEQVPDNLKLVFLEKVK